MKTFIQFLAESETQSKMHKSVVHALSSIHASQKDHNPTTPKIHAGNGASFSHQIGSDSAKEFGSMGILDHHGDKVNALMKRRGWKIHADGPGDVEYHHRNGMKVSHYMDFDDTRPNHIRHTIKPL